MEVRIERGIPLPPRNPPRNASQYKPTALQMRVGDSVYFENPKEGPSGLSSALKAIGCRCSMRKQGSGCRVWRITDE